MSTPWYKGRIIEGWVGGVADLKKGRASQRKGISICKPINKKTSG